MNSIVRNVENVFNSDFCTVSIVEKGDFWTVQNQLNTFQMALDLPLKKPLFYALSICMKQRQFCRAILSTPFILKVILISSMCKRISTFSEWTLSLPFCMIFFKFVSYLNTLFAAIIVQIRFIHWRENSKYGFIKKNLCVFYGFLLLLSCNEWTQCDRSKKSQKKWIHRTKIEFRWGNFTSRIQTHRT